MKSRTRAYTDPGKRREHTNDLPLTHFSLVSSREEKKPFKDWWTKTSPHTNRPFLNELIQCIKKHAPEEQKELLLTATKNVFRSLLSHSYPSNAAVFRSILLRSTKLTTSPGREDFEYRPIKEQVQYVARRLAEEEEAKIKQEKESSPSSVINGPL